MTNGDFSLLLSLASTWTMKQTSPQFSQERRSKDVEDGEIIPSLKVRLGVQANDKRRQVFHPINVQGGVNFDKSTAEYV